MLLKCGMEISITKTGLNWLHKRGMSVWKVANGKFQFSYLQAGTINLKSLVVQ